MKIILIAIFDAPGNIRQWSITRTPVIPKARESFQVLEDEEEKLDII